MDFVTAFAPGKTVGIGITYSVPKNLSSSEQTQQGRLIDIDAFFIMNTRKTVGGMEMWHWM